MYREAENYLKIWIQQKRRKPLVIRGARQVGKSTLVRAFCESQNLILCEVNLEKHVELDAIFSTLEMPLIIKELSAIVRRDLLSDKRLILFLDEIQATPSALAALRYFYEEYPYLPVIAAGSLLDFALQDHEFSMPVGRINYFHLSPMSFKEFLRALNEEYLIELIEQYDFEKTIPNSAHQKLTDRQREYLFIGGMPEAVLAYSESGSLLEATRVHESILSTFQDDFIKYTRNKNEQMRLQNLLKFIPANIGCKVKYSRISKEDQARDIKHALQLLALARVCSLVPHSSCSGVPISAQENPNVYKSLFLDVGLVNRVLGLDWSTVRSKSEISLINEGGLAEQYIGQHLLYRHHGEYAPNLNYWLREERASNAEVDYVIAVEDLILPIEVKAGSAGSLRSLHQFIQTKKSKLAARFDTNVPSFSQFQHHVRVKSTDVVLDYHLLSLPLYMVEELVRLVKCQSLL